MGRSLRQAIDRFCRHCLYDERATGLGHWRQQIEACTSKKCPLYKVRPRTKAAVDPNAGGAAPRDEGKRGG